MATNQSTEHSSHGAQENICFIGNISKRGNALAHVLEICGGLSAKRTATYTVHSEYHADASLRPVLRVMTQCAVKCKWPVTADSHGMFY